MNLSQAGVDKDTIKLESEVVQASKEESQPITPYWTAIMLGGYAQGKAELKVFSVVKRCNGRFWCQKHGRIGSSQMAGGAAATDHRIIQ